MKGFVRCGLLLACCLPSAAWAWRYLEPQSPRPANAQGFATTADGGLLVSNSDGIRRYDANGAAKAFLAGPIGGPGETYLLPLPDGDAMLVDWQFGCGVSRLDGTLRRRWSEYTLGCRPAANANGDVWLNDNARLHRLSGDGRVVASVAAAAVNGTAIHAFAVAADGGAFAASNTNTSGGDTTVARFDRTGTRRWAWAAKDIQVQSIWPLGDGSILVGGIKPREPAVFGKGELYLAVLDANGAAKWSYRLPDADYRPELVAPTGTSATYALASFPGTLPKLLRVESGELKWQRDVCVTPNATRPHLSALPNGDVVLVCRNGDVARFQRYDAAGSLKADTALPLAEVLQLGAIADGRFLLAGIEPGAGAGQTRMIAVNGSGTAVDSPLTSLQASEALIVLQRHFDADGTSYLVTQARSIPTELPPRHYVSKIGADGRLVWRRAFELPLEPQVKMSLGGGMVCVTGARKELRDFGPTPIQHAIECINVGDGSVRWGDTVAITTGLTENFSRVLDDGTLVIVFDRDGGHEFVRYNPAGAVIARTRGAELTLAVSINAQGRTTFLASSGAGRSLVQYDAQGARRFATPLPDRYNFVHITPDSTAADGSVLAFLRYEAVASERRFALWSVAADGTSRWTRPLDPNVRRSDVVRAGDATYLVLDDANVNSSTQTQIHAISPQNGATLWRADSTDSALTPEHWGPLLDYLPAGARVAANADGVVFVTSWAQRLRVQRFDATSGFRTQESFVACADECAQPRGIALDASGNARVALTVSDATAGTTGAVLSLPGGSGRIRIDQPGIAGAWWSPYANGEGFVLDYLPASRTFFMPWFTFSRDGGNDPAGQRWYVVQGSVPANATSVELPITESAGGVFDAGPTVQARIVGKATLNFSDCNNGTMRYQFDAATNGAATGTITLSRLTPTSDSCQLADGTTVPGAGAMAPANGFDARMSGSWFEQATSGQGLQFVVQPGGVFFAPWFTFDPAGPSDDPDRQRWFTLQGSLADARNGTVEAPIVQTIGGAFDSVPTNNMTIVGKATVTFGACDRAKVEYRFDDTEIAGAMRALVGSTDLVKIGGCATR